MIKGYSAIVTVAFVGLIQTVNPPIWAIAALTIAIYEICMMTVRIAKKTSQKKQKRRYITATRADMRRVEEEVFNPLRRMREVSR
jgi:hypothetical protein